MPKLVAEGADRCARRPRAAIFGGAGVRSQTDTPHLDVQARQVAAVRPYRVRAATFRLVVAGVEDKHIVQHAISVGVIVLHVNPRGSGFLTRFYDKRIRLTVVVTAFLCTIVGHLVVCLIRTIDVKDRGEKTVRRRNEVVASRTGRTVVRVATLVQQVAEVLFRLCKGKVGKAHQYHQRARAARQRESGAEVGLLRFAETLSNRLCGLNNGGVYLKKARLHEPQRRAVGQRVVTVMLVAVQINREDRAVRLCHLNRVGRGWHCRYMQAYESECTSE